MSNQKSPTCHPERKYYAKGLCNACYCKLQYKKHPERFADHGKGWIKAHPEYMLFASAKQRAKRKNLEFSIILTDLVIPSHCPVLGLPLIPFSGKFAHNSPSLDRIDNTKGYTKDNTRIISFRANSLKKDATPDELRKVADFFSSQ